MTFGTHFGRQGFPKIEHFGTKSPKNQEKSRPGDGLEKTNNWDAILMPNWEALGGENVVFTLDS